MTGGRRPSARSRSSRRRGRRREPGRDPAVHDGMRLRIELVVEVEREPVLVGERREADDERRERDDAEGDRSSIALRGATSRRRRAALARSRGSSRNATAKTTANTTRSGVDAHGRRCRARRRSTPRSRAGGTRPTRAGAAPARGAPREREVVEPDDRRERQGRGDREREAPVAPGRCEEHEADDDMTIRAAASEEPVCTRSPNSV